jgi:hypothetical protein
MMPLQLATRGLVQPLPLIVVLQVCRLSPMSIGAAANVDAAGSRDAGDAIGAGKVTGAGGCTGKCNTHVSATARYAATEASPAAATFAVIVAGPASDAAVALRVPLEIPP